MALQNPVAQSDKKKLDGPAPKSHPRITPTARNNPITNPFSARSRSPVDQWEGKPISPQTPQAVVDARVNDARWNAGFANGGLSSSYADSPTADSQIHPANRLNGLVRPTPAADATQSLDTPETRAPATLPTTPKLTKGTRLVVPFSENPGAPASPTNGGALTPSEVQHQIIDNAGAGDATRFGGRVLTNPNGTTTTVFSDGSNGTQRTVSANQIKAASNALTAADARALTNPLASDVAGHPVSSEDMIQQRMAEMSRNSGRLIRPASARDYAMSDLIAAATGDWRSPIGTAAHNARVESNSGTVRNRRQGEETRNKLIDAATQRVRDAGGLANTATQEAGATQRTRMQEAGANARTSATERGASARTAATLRQPVQVALPGGGLGLMNPSTGKVTPVQYNGQSVQSNKPTAAQQRTQKLVDQLRADASKALAARQKNQVPGADGKIAQPTPQDMQQILLNQAYIQGYAPQVNPQTGQIALNINGQQVLL